MLLSVVVLALSVPLTYSDGASAYCNSRGVLTCHCNMGHSGPTCQTAINYCTEPVDGFDFSSNATLYLSDLCYYGSCASTTHGAYCICDPGFQGPFCDQTIQGDTDIITRCMIYNTSQVNEPECPDDYRCIPDNLNCLFPSFHCPSPIGWCLPAEQANKILTQFGNENTEQEFGALDSSPCSGNGQPSCNCIQGYTGNTCQSEVDWCTTPLDQPFGINNFPPQIVTMGSLCGPHGECNSDPLLGASCTCAKGWTGQFCDTPICNETLVASRCCLYRTPDSAECLQVQINCNPGFRCLTDNLDCSFQPCNDPIGWCLPIATDTCPEHSTPTPPTTTPAPTPSILIMGGITSAQDSTDNVTVYNPEDGSRSYLQKLPEKRSAFVLTKTHGAYVLLGGTFSDSHSSQALILSEGEANSLNLTFNHMWAAGGNIGDTIIICGGYNMQMFCEKLDMQSMTFVMAAPMLDGGRQAAAYAVYNDDLYIAGGKNNDNQVSNSAFKLNSTSITWSRTSSMRQQRYASAGAIYNDKFVVCGGNDASTYLNTCEQYSFDTDSWTNIPSMNQRRTSHGMVAVGGYLYALGGVAGVGSILSTVEVYDGHHWTYAPFILDQPLFNFGIIEIVQ